MAKNDGELKFEITNHISNLSGPNEKGWRMELNEVKWGDAKEPKFDIRQWNEDHTRMGKGVTLTYDQLAIMVSDIQDKGIC